MAEILGTAASVIQVAEVGFRLATTLYKYASSVKGAEKDIKQVARDVKVTSKVLEITHKQLKADQSLCSNDALSDLEEVLEGCKEAFQEVDITLNKSLRPGPNGQLQVSTMEKFKWPLRSTKLDVLRANLEKLKTSLLLMLSVLAYGCKISQSATRTDSKVEFFIDQLQIQSLVTAKEVATKQYDELLAAFSQLEAKVSANTDQISAMTRTAGVPEAKNPWHLLFANVDGSTNNSDDPTRSEISQSLEFCARAVAGLAESIDVATKQWRAETILSQGTILSHLDHTIGRIDELTDLHNALPSNLLKGIVYSKRRLAEDKTLPPLVVGEQTLTIRPFYFDGRSTPPPALHDAESHVSYQNFYRILASPSRRPYSLALHSIHDNLSNANNQATEPGAEQIPTSVRSHHPSLSPITSRAPTKEPQDVPEHPINPTTPIRPPRPKDSLDDFFASLASTDAELEQLHSELAALKPETENLDARPSSFISKENRGRTETSDRVTAQINVVEVYNEDVHGEMNKKRKVAAALFQYGNYDKNDDDDDDDDDGGDGDGDGDVDGEDEDIVGDLLRRWTNVAMEPVTHNGK